MKYSLRSLMVGITLACVLLGGRIEYLRRWASFHEREAERYAGLVCSEQKISRAELDLLLSFGIDVESFPLPMGSPPIGSVAINNRIFDFRYDDRMVSLKKHREQAAAYRKVLRWPAADE